MGIIRKSASIATLGIVPFRSRKELLKRAEKARLEAEAELQREQAARAEADQRVTAAEKRVQRAELTALHEAQVAAKAKSRSKGGRGRRGRKGRRERAKEMVGDLMAAAQPVVEEQAKQAGRRARKAAKASRHAAERASEEAGRRGRRARARMREVEKTMAPRVDAAAARAQDLKDELIDLSTTAADKVKERAEATRSGR